MRVTISASNNEQIDKIYITESEKLADYLARKGCELNWGSGSLSVMKACYDSFVKYDRNIYGYVTSKYLFELERLPKAQHREFKDTLELKRSFFFDSDLYIALPGGLGTISELIAFIEEARSNDALIPIIIYNVNHHFDSTLALFKDLEERKFNSSSIYNYFKVIDNLEDFKKYFEENFRV